MPAVATTVGQIAPPMVSTTGSTTATGLRADQKMLPTIGHAGTERGPS
jgi:hypothetical protein